MICNALKHFTRDEGASATIGGIFFTTAALAVSGLALDQANAWQQQTHLQIATDAAALAAAMEVNDFEAARTEAVTIAAFNLGRSGIVTSSDVVFGVWDEGTATFVSTDDEEAANAVKVTADLSRAGGDAVATHLLKLVGINSWDVGAVTIAINEPAAGASGGGGSGGTTDININCNMMTVISYGSIQTGGGNHLNKGVCIHGQMGVATGGGDHYDRDVTFSAPFMDDIYIASYKPNNIDYEDLAMERFLEPTILPMLDDIFVDLWSTLYTGAPTTYYGDLLPDFIFEGGAANVVIKEGWWAIQPGEIEENTIYVVNGGAQFSGNLDAKNVAFIVNGYFGTGGGYNLHFRDVYIIGRNVNLAGNVTWGENGTQCKTDHFSVYLFGLESLSMGGWGNDVSVNGVVGASPSWNPGGNMKARNIYFETGTPGYYESTDMQGANETSLGGDLSINGNDCSYELDVMYPLATRADQAAGVEGNKLSRILR